MTGDASSAGARQAGSFLRELLSGRYRRRWSCAVYIERSRPGGVHHRAVACVLAEYLWENPRRDGDIDISPDRLTPMVSKSLNGRELARHSLQLFIDAFEMSEDDAARLWRIYNGSDKIRLVTGLGAPPPGIQRGLRRGMFRKRTVHDRHYVGADRLPLRHLAHEVLEATEDDPEPVLQLVFDANCLVVEVEEGGRLAGPVYQVNSDFYAVDISLDQPLSTGETTALTHSISFHYGEPPPPEYRRIVRNRIDSLGMRVEFHQDKLPGHVWWAQWDIRSNEVADREEVLLRNGRYVYRYVENVEKIIVGFAWEW